MFYNGTPIFWRTGLFKCIALSSMEAELMAVSEAAKAAIHVIRTIQELQLHLTLPVTIWCDNVAAIAAIQKPSTNRRSRHIEVRHFLIREQEGKRLFKLRYIPTAFNLADIGTKPLAADTFVQLRDQIFVNVPDHAWRRV